MTNIARESTSHEKNRVVMLGAGRVGKTSIIQRLLFDSFSDKYRPTVEDIYHQEFNISGHRVALDLMDTSGTYNFPAMRRLCIAKATACVIVLALNDTYSLQHGKEVLTQIKEERTDWEETPLVVVLNKNDLPSAEKEMVEEEVETWLTSEQVPLTSLVSTSAKDGDGVFLLFEKLWEQNERHSRFHFSHSPAPDCKRRFSAFATFGSGTSTKSGHTNGHGPDHGATGSGSEFRKKGKFLRSKTSMATRRMSTNRSATGNVYSVDCAIS